MCDVSKLRVGDVVHVRVEIENINDTVLPVGVRYGPITFRPSKGDIVHVEPRPLKVGDRVRWLNDVKSNIFEIRAVVDDRVAVIRSEGGAYHAIQHISSLERVE